jgi:hypothetical protein
MPLSTETVREIRRRYAEGVVVSVICAEFGVKSWQVYQCADGGPAGAERLPPLPRRRLPAVQRGRRLGNAARRAMIARLWHSAHDEVDELSQRLARAAGAAPDGERERNTRLLATLARTLQQLMALDPMPTSRPAKKDVPRDDDDSVPRDLDELRRELARRVDRLRRGRGAAGPVRGATG